jgi:hypothetical protein
VLALLLPCRIGLPCRALLLLPPLPFAHSAAEQPALLKSTAERLCCRRTLLLPLPLLLPFIEKLAALPGRLTAVSCPLI